ncbi:hypothetical protein AA0535_2373 [Asaia krungthepensis NRIC 0535]|uniref:Uncharacterized protein n=1 Tax=Asaia krungthepensis NRIC 0535 TaxID=1307925 RepID=A0ABQ0Q531_9PROT|nr:hypothetical protein AA0535_2373 [Asaia krungthepensis NRIC 0535]
MEDDALRVSGERRKSQPPAPRRYLSAKSGNMALTAGLRGPITRLCGGKTTLARPIS